MDIDDKPTKNTKRAGKKHETFIQEDPDSIVDLADLNAIGQITSLFCNLLNSCTKAVTVNLSILTATKPIPSTSGLSANGEQKKSKPRDVNRGFKMATDGRLIIAEPKRGDRRNDSESDDDEDIGDKEMSGTSSKKRPIAADSDSDSENEDVPPRKRKTTGALSQASGKTGASGGSRKYVAGGRGIHRPIGGAGSVASGASRMSMATTKAAASQYGSEYKAKKSKGDTKKKNQLDPYAYIPLSRNVLNKR